jgi:hypothetical protein
MRSPFVSPRLGKKTLSGFVILTSRLPMRMRGVSRITLQGHVTKGTLFQNVIAGSPFNNPRHSRSPAHRICGSTTFSRRAFAFLKE